MQIKNYILYADDDVDDREMMEELFASQSDYLLLTFNDGEALINHLDQVNKERICLVVLDMNMPLLDGMKTLQQIRNDSQFLNLPVIMYTTSSSPVDKTLANKLNAEVVIKPVTHNQLRVVAARMLEHCKVYVNR